MEEWHKEAFGLGFGHGERATRVSRKRVVVWWSVAKQQEGGWLTKLKQKAQARLNVDRSYANRPPTFLLDNRVCVQNCSSNGGRDVVSCHW